MTNKIDSNLSWGRIGMSLLLGLILFYCFFFKGFRVSSLFGTARFHANSLPFFNGVLLYGLTAISVLVMSFHAFRNRNFKTNFGFFQLSYLAFILWAICSILWSENKSNAIGVCCILTTGYLIYSTLTTYIRSDYQKSMNFLSLIIAIFSLVFIFLYFYLNWDALSLLNNSNVHYQKVVQKSHSMIGGKNQTAVFISLLLPIHLYFVWMKQNKLLNLIPTILIIFMIMIIGSRAAYIALFVTGLILLFVNKINFKYLLYFLGGFCVLLFIYFQFVSFDKLMTQLGHNSVDSRFLMWTKTFELFLKNPLHGNGIAQWDTYNSLLDLKRFVHPHNDYLRVLAELGIIGFLLFLNVLINLFLKAIKIIHFNSEKRNYAYSILLGGLATYCLLSMQEEVLIKINTFVIATILFSLISYHFEKTKDGDFNSNLNKPILSINLLLSILLIVSCTIYISSRNQFKTAYKLLKRDPVKSLDILENNVNTLFVNRYDLAPIYFLRATEYEKTNEEEKYYADLFEMEKQFPSNYYGSLKLFDYFLENDKPYKAYKKLEIMAYVNPCNEYTNPNFNKFQNKYPEYEVDAISKLKQLITSRCSARRRGKKK